MLSVAQQRPWTCLQCLLRRQRGQRHLSTTIAGVTRAAFDRLRLRGGSAAPDANHDDRTIRQVFDSRPVWQEFSRKARRRPFGQSSGLFRNRYLKSPDGFGTFAGATLVKCKRLVARILGVSTADGYKTIVKDLDVLSDHLCRVIDPCDFVRASHPDVRYQNAATSAYTTMFEYMNQLNTTTGLHDQLRTAMADPEVVGAWTEEEKITAKILMRDFAKSAIDLPVEAKQRFVGLSNEIQQLGSEFVDRAAPAQQTMILKAGETHGLEPALVESFQRGGKVFLPVGGAESTMALRTIENADTRRRIYLASRTSRPEQVRRLERLLKRRAEIAKLSGFSSYAHMTLAEKMAGSPESVNRFLDALSRSNQPRVRAETRLFSPGRGLPAPQTAGSVLNAWDKDYYMSKYKMQNTPATARSETLEQFFSLGTVMQGLSRLFSRLYGIRLVPRETSPGETWNDDVRRLDVVDEDEGHMAVLYCDLFERPGKNPNPAHFTLRCSRRIWDDELAEAASQSQGRPDAEEEEKEEGGVTDGMASARNARGELYQLPTVALLCDFSRSNSHGGDRPTLLSFRDVQTLFHEMGHAVHSVLGRTSMQNVSGTRCATDFAELPSVLMEDFAADRDVLSLFARHWHTDASLPYELVAEKVRLNQSFEGLDIQSQIVLAAVDQAYHSALPLQHASFDSTAVYHDVVGRYAPSSSPSFVEPRETSWQGQFGHLFGYGATYYSYLFDRAIAGKVWADVFKHSEGGSVSRASGAKFRDEVLRWGGSRDGWTCVAAVLGDDSLADGGEAAMAKVGRWGVASQMTGVDGS